MFNRNSSGDSAGPSEAEQTRPAFRMPALSTWEISYWPDDVNDDEKLVHEVVTGHGMTLDKGTIVIQTFYMDPAFGPTPRPTWGRTEYVSFKDITPVVEPSRLVS